MSFCHVSQLNNSLRVKHGSLTISVTHYSQSLPVLVLLRHCFLERSRFVVQLRQRLAWEPTCKYKHRCRQCLQVQTHLMIWCDPKSSNMDWCITWINGKRGSQWTKSGQIDLNLNVFFLSGHTCSIVFYTQSLSIVCNMCDICKQASVGPVQHLTSQQVLLEFLDLTGKQFPDLSDWQPHMLQQ